ncbi:hypothetical protein FRC10_005632 [Ceratobasidium sp. 414]|nr:hypothetical protein FRC10_005632 [Ceratobasidium sp. 414]
MPAGETSIFAGSVAKTLASLDTGYPNVTLVEPHFTTVAESSEDLLSRNIVQVLQTEEISTKLINCRPIEPSDNATFNIELGEGAVLRAVLGIADGPQNQLVLLEPLSSPSEIMFPNNGTPFDKTYMFVMQTPPDNLVSPFSLSTIAIALVDGDVCTNVYMQTPFGNLTPFNSTPLGLPLTIAGIICNLQRTRSQYDGYTKKRTTQSYLSPPIIYAANTAFQYGPISSTKGLGGVGELLYQHVNGGNKWRIPQCNTSSPSAPWNVDNTELWSRAVQLVELYESSLLQSADQLAQSPKQVRVSVSTVAYQLAILPAALLVFGLFLGALCCLLMYLLVFWSWIPHGCHPLEPLRIVDEVDRNNSIGARLPANRPTELAPKKLDNTLGAKRLRRHALTFEEG